MKQIVVEIPESKYEFFDELMSQLGFVQKSKSKEKLVYASIAQGLREVNLIKAGKLPKKPIQNCCVKFDIYYTPEFEKQLKRLSKKHKSLPKDLGEQIQK